MVISNTQYLGRYKRTARTLLTTASQIQPSASVVALLGSRNRLRLLEGGRKVTALKEKEADRPDPLAGLITVAEV